MNGSGVIALMWTATGPAAAELTLLQEMTWCRQAVRVGLSDYFANHENKP